jgi:hypothetical protein
VLAGWPGASDIGMVTPGLLTIRRRAGVATHFKKFRNQDSDPSTTIAHLARESEVCEHISQLVHAFFTSPVPSRWMTRNPSHLGFRTWRRLTSGLLRAYRLIGG